MVCPCTRSIHQNGCRKFLSSAARDEPLAALSLDRFDALAGVKLTVVPSKLAQVRLKQCIGIKSRRIPVGNSEAGIVLEDWTKVMNLFGIETLEFGKAGNFALELVEGLALVLARMDEERLRTAQGNRREPVWRVIEK